MRGENRPERKFTSIVLNSQPPGHVSNTLNTAGVLSAIAFNLDKSQILWLVKGWPNDGYMQ